ncbi:chromate transporter [Actinacidiphila oryziradicis]|uniref:Chromate transporter n=1 Tax=Actinacidiphila oryziradicis TaxID=2571141 RepID=A0A4U0SPZ0_9ACTN|nr:chromate transporter [Actinacidiphila oryziradicis]TKA10271.1 chromate transporter [Actinacidiphila oryziradicis]
MTSNTPEGEGTAHTIKSPHSGGPAPPGFASVLRYFLRLGTLGFGGPIAVVGYMQRDLVQACGWISKQDFLDGVALGQTMPGPLAAQVARWVGYLKRACAGLLPVDAVAVCPCCASRGQAAVRRGYLRPVAVNAG